MADGKKYLWDADGNELVEGENIKDILDDVSVLKYRFDKFQSGIKDILKGLSKLLIYLFGSSLAIVISYSENHSILWGIGHGLLSWVYVLYFAIRE